MQDHCLEFWNYDDAEVSRSGGNLSWSSHAFTVNPTMDKVSPVLQRLLSDPLGACRIEDALSRAGGKLSTRVWRRALAAASSVRGAKQLVLERAYRPASHLWLWPLLARDPGRAARAPRPERHPPGGRSVSFSRRKGKAAFAPLRRDSTNGTSRNANFEIGHGALRCLPRENCLALRQLGLLR